MKDTELKNRLIEFTINILELTKKLPNSIENQIFFKQIIRSSSSIGANYSEAMFAYSKIDFLHCINISRKESNETLYWLEVINKSNPKYSKIIEVQIEEAESILKIFIASTKTVRKNINLNEK